MNKKEFKELGREQMIIAFNQLKDDYSSLFNELEQEKEKNKELQKQLNGAFDRGFISKDKIKEKIEQAKQKADDDNLDEYIKISAWKELLEEE